MLDKLASLENRFDELERLLANPEISADYAQVQKLAKEHASIKNLVSLSRQYRDITQAISDTQAISRDQSDQELASLAHEELIQLDKQKLQIEDQIRLALVSKDPNDDKNVFVEIRAGTGGDEAGLFAADLFRMYSRYAQRNKWNIEIVNSNETGLGSIKEIVFQVNGNEVYSRLKHEIGGHRVQRIPITESGGRIHTSAATVAVLPEAKEVDVQINPNDLKIDIFRASGHGGQNVQKVETAVRITHLPTNIVATCQDETSQLKNKEKAMAVLRSRVLAQEIERQQAEITEERRSQIGTGDRSERVRTYNFPQDRVTDHRTSLSKHNLNDILDGNIDEFVDAMIAKEQAELLDQAGI